MFYPNVNIQKDYLTLYFPVIATATLMFFHQRENTAPFHVSADRHLLAVGCWSKLGRQ